MTVRALSKPLAFLRRDLLVAISYKFKFLLQLLGIFVSTLMFFFLSRLVGGGVEGQLKPYGGDYFAFVIVGVAFTDYLSVSLGGFSSQIRNAQVMGTLEALLVTPTSVPTILFSSTLYNFAFSSLRVVLYLLIGVMLFGLKLHITSIVSFVMIMVLTVLSFSGIGLFSAAFIIVFKQSSPVNWLINISSALLGGVIYPVSVLPGWLKPFASLLPITHALEGIRRVILMGAAFTDVYKEIIILALFVIVLLPLGLVSFSYALRIAKKEGSLIQY